MERKARYFNLNLMGHLWGKPFRSYYKLHCSKNLRSWQCGAFKYKFVNDIVKAVRCCNVGVLEDTVSWRRRSRETGLHFYFCIERIS